jgi:pyrroloquinoline quinone biosynthesis protein D
MAESLDRAEIMRLAPAYRIQWEQTKQVYMLLYPDGLVTLSSTAGEVLKRCDGRRTVGDIIKSLREQYPVCFAESEVLGHIQAACAEGWLVPVWRASRARRQR